MSILFMPATGMAMAEGAGGLFDFNATLPLMALQIILLSVVLTFVFSAADCGMHLPLISLD